MNYIFKIQEVIRGNPMRVIALLVLVIVFSAFVFCVNAGLKQDSYLDPQAMILDGEWDFHNGKINTLEAADNRSWHEKVTVPKPLPEFIKKRLASEFWYRKNIEIRDKNFIHDPAISLGSIKGEHEVYWNGTYIGSGGRASLAIYRLPAINLKNGLNQLFVKVKKSETMFPGIVHFRSLYLGNAVILEKQISEYYLQTGVKPLFSVGFKLFFFFTFGIFYLLIPKRREYFSFAMFALFSGLSNLLYSRFVPGYESYLFKQSISFVFSTLSLCILPILTADFLRFTEKNRSFTRIISYSLAIVFIGSTFFLKNENALLALIDISGVWVSKLVLIFSFMLTIYSYWKLKYVLRLKHRALQVLVFSFSLLLGGLVWSSQGTTLANFQMVMMQEMLDLGIFLGFASALALDFRFASIQSQKSRKVVPKWFVGFLATGTEKAVIEIPLLVLAVDIAGYTKHLFALDEVGRKEYHDRIRAALGSLVADHGAEKLSDRGDGGLFAWDFPEASKDKKVAIQKAFFAIRSLFKISELQSDLHFRVGLSAGVVRCEWREGEISYLGDALNIASRLEGIAKPGSALLAEALLEFIDGCDLDEKLIAEERKGIVYKARSLKPAA